MKKIQRRLIVTTLLAAAVACYLTGYHSGSFALLSFGILFELLFWINLFGKNPKESQ